MLEADLTARFRALSNAYIKATGRTRGTVWASAIKDGRFLDRVEAGGAFTARSYDKILNWFDANWPAGAPWPEGVPRPSNPLEREPALATLGGAAKRSANTSAPRAGWGARLMRQWGGKRNGR